jgi:hypothetical protein
MSRIFGQLFLADENKCHIFRPVPGKILFALILYQITTKGVTLIKPVDGEAILDVGNADCMQR